MRKRNLIKTYKDMSVVFSMWKQNGQHRVAPRCSKIYRWQMHFFSREASTWHSDAFRQWDSSWQTLVSRCTRHARRTDPPSTDDQCAQVKSTATEIERKIFHLCGLLVRLHRPMRWHEMTCTRWSFDYDIHVDLRCFTRQTYPRTPRFDRYLWPISSYWPTEFRGAASWDVSIFLKLWSFAIIWYHLITIRNLIRTVDQQSFAPFVINCFNPLFFLEVWFVWIKGLCVTVCWLITVVGVCGSLGAPQMILNLKWSF